MFVTGAATTVTLTNLTVRNGNSVNFGGGIGISAGTVVTNNVTVSGNKFPVRRRRPRLPGRHAHHERWLDHRQHLHRHLRPERRRRRGLRRRPDHHLGRDARRQAQPRRRHGQRQHRRGCPTSNSSGNRGGIFNAGTTVVKDSTFTGNKTVTTTNATTVRSGQGGAIFNGANDTDDVPVLTVQNSTITGGLPEWSVQRRQRRRDRQRRDVAGRHQRLGSLTMTGTTLRGNAALLGGGLYNGGTINVTGGLIENNAAYSGGGVYQAPIVLPATPTTIGEFNGTTFNNNLATGLTLANFGNGGAIFNTEKLTVRNATFTANKAIASTSGGTASGWGAAIWNGAFAAGDAPDLTVTNTTMSGGTATIGGAIASTSNVFGFATAISAKLDATNLDVRQHRGRGRRHLRRRSGHPHGRFADAERRQPRERRLRRRSLRRPGPGHPACLQRDARQRRRHGQHRLRRRWRRGHARQGDRRDPQRVLGLRQHLRDQRRRHLQHR